MADENMIMDPASGLMLDEAAQQIAAENPPPPIFKVPPRSPTPTGEEFMGLPTLPQDGYEQKDIQNFLKTLKDNPVSTLTKPQKDTAANVLKQYTLTTAQLNAAQGETLPENFNLPAYGEIYAPIFEQQFPAIKNTDDLLANGLIDDNGATDKGLLVLDLKKVGALNDDYTLNLTGKALLSSPEEAEKPENLAIFMERQRLELDEPEDKSWGATWNEFKKILGSTRDTLTALIPEGTAPTAPTAFMPPGAYYMPTGKEAEVGYTEKQKAILEGAVSGIIQQESGLALGAKKIASDILVKIVSDGEKEKVALAAIDQKYQRDKRQIEAYKASESFHEITGLTNWVDQMEKVKTELGDEGFKAARKTGMEGGPMLYSAINPLAAENLAFRTAMSASMVPMKLMSSQVLRARQTAEAFVEQTQSLNAANAAISKAQASIKFGEKIPELEKAQLAFQQAGDMASARSVGKNIEKVRTASQKAVFEVEQWGKAAQSITENLTRLSADAAAANRIIKVADTFAQWPKVITTPVGYSLQKLGQGMTAIDSNLAAASEKIGAGKFYRGMNKLSSLAGVGTVAQTAGLPGELAWFPAAFKAAWSTAPAIEATGDFIRLVGREASAARGAIPMWRKIYRMQDAGIAHRLVAGSMDLATLGGLPAVQNAVKGAVAGTAAGVPLDMAYNYVSSGGDMNANAFKESVVSNAFFAGGGAAIGAIRMGSQKRLKQFQQGDVLNFRRSITDPDQKMAFDALPRGVRDSLGSYSGANPNLIIKFVKEGGGNFVPSTNTVSINPAAKNPLKPLLAHELLESIVARTSMSSSIASILVGDGVQTGGLLRDKNGNLDPDFIAFRDRYNQLRQAETNRMNQMVEPDKRKKFTPLTDREMAKEYFIEMNADDMAAMAESGKLGQLAARSTAVRKMVDLGNTILNKSSIIRNMHFNLGGMMDSSGRMVSGNGLLADGIKQLPEAKALFERMINETAGRPGAAKQIAEKSQGTVIPTSGMDDPIWSEMTSYWKTDKAGNPIKDSSGNWVPLEKYIEDAREQAGLIIQADQKQRIANGEVIPKHEIQYSPETGWRGKYFSAAQIEMVKNTGYFNDSQIKLFDHINEAAKRGQGERFLMIYNPATSSRLRNRGRKSYETLGPTMKEGGILGFSMGEKGQILIDIIDTQQLHQNIMEQAGKKIGKKLYKNDVDKIMSDINAVMELHAEGKPADSHFIENYGTDWKDYKNFINATFGDISGGAKARPGEWAMINPVLVTDRPSNAVFKTYRLDRTNKATRMEGTTGIPMDYNKVKANYMPEGVPLFTEDGDPVDMRYTPVEDENGNLRAVPSNDYGKQNGVASEEVITQNQRTNESGQRIAGTGTGDRTIEGDASTTGEILGRGGMVGSSVRVRPPDSSPYWNTPLSGLPTKVTIESRGETVDFGPNDTARKAAWDYAESSGIKYNPPETYSIVSKEQGKRLADGYEAMVHSPNDPKVKASYDAMIKETLDQYQFIKKTGLKIEPIPLGMVDPYLETPRLANLDVLENNHLWFFPTDSGFGTKGVTAKKVLNLLESPTDEYIGNHRLLANDVFRIVHDYFGHIKEGVGFRGDGEENAWRSHSAMYSDLARPAMTSETRGQNMWVNHGPYAEHNRKANGANTIYAEQKNALPPEWMVNEGAGDTPPASTTQYMPEVAVVPERFTGSKEDTERRGKYVEPPNFFKRFNIESYERGGKFFDKETGDDLTGKGYGTGSIDVSTGKPSLFVDGEEKPNLEGSRFKTNLFKQSAGWKWISENPPSTSTIVSVEGKGKHVYTLKANFENGVHLTRYSEKASEPRLRPTAIGEIQTGTPVGTISIRGREHPVYDSVGIVSKETAPPASTTQYMPEVVDPEDKGIQAPIGSLGELRKNVDIRKSDLPADATSVPKFVARQGADDDWKVMEGPLRVARGNYLTPLPNIKIKKTKVSVQNQNLIQNSFLARDTNATTPKELNDKQNAIRNANDALAKIDSAVKEIESDPQKFINPKGYAETMKKAGVTGDVLIPPSSLKMMLNDPDSFAELLSGGYHGDKTVAGIRDSAMSGLDSVVEMRELIGGRPPELITAIHHLWGTLSKQLPPLQQEALWMRMITNKDVMKQIGESINGTYNQSPDQWKNTVKKARSSTVGTYGKLGNNATSNANSFYLMLSKHNGRWNEVSDVYKYDDPVQMRYAFNTLGHGATGIKNKVQSFIGLTFGIKGNVLDRWRFVDMYLDDAMKITGAKNAREYFKYEGKKKNVPVDKIGIYKNYGTIENKSPLFSLALYSGMDRVSQAAINASPALQTLLGNHADPGGLHWLSWNAIKNEAVGHSSLDITKNFIKQYAKGGKFDQLTVDNFLKFVNSTEAFVEGTSGGGEEITRLTLKNGVFSHSKK